ncbi:MAG: hypothetical protein DI571_09400 [Arsenicicoccus sp.]|nr:MAG: hypothetical protein DI571_09400 [Arsenicicoccus sp.]
MADRTASRGSAPDPVLELLLDPGRLSGLLRTPVRVTRVRPKPGVSHTAVLLGPDGRVLGWIQALIGPARAKAVKARERAQRYGLAEQISSVPLPQWDAELVWGGLATDPALAKPLRRSGLDLTADDLVLLRYNPLRRLVLRAGDEVVRVTAEPHAQRMATVSQALAAQGLPVVTPRGSGEGSTGDGRATSGRVGPGVTTSGGAGEVASGRVGRRVMTSGRVSVWPWVEGTDLARDAEHPADLVRAAHLAGALAARLHMERSAGRGRAGGHAGRGGRAGGRRHRAACPGRAAAVAAGGWQRRGRGFRAGVRRHCARGHQAVPARRCALHAHGAEFCCRGAARGPLAGPVPARR